VFISLINSDDFFLCYKNGFLQNSSILKELLQNKDSFYRYCLQGSDISTSRKSPVDLSTSCSFIVSLQLKFYELITHRMAVMLDYFKELVPRFTPQESLDAIKPEPTFQQILRVILKCSDYSTDSLQDFRSGFEEFHQKYCYFFEGKSGYQAIAVNCCRQFAAAEKNSLSSAVPSKKVSLGEKRSVSSVPKAAETSPVDAGSGTGHKNKKSRRGLVGEQSAGSGASRKPVTDESRKNYDRKPAPVEKKETSVAENPTSKYPQSTDIVARNTDSSQIISPVVLNENRQDISVEEIKSLMEKQYNEFSKNLLSFHRSSQEQRSMIQEQRSMIQEQRSMIYHQQKIMKYISLQVSELTKKVHKLK